MCAVQSLLRRRTDRLPNMQRCREGRHCAKKIPCLSRFTILRILPGQFVFQSMSLPKNLTSQSFAQGQEISILVRRWRHPFDKLTTSSDRSRCSGGAKAVTSPRLSPKERARAWGTRLVLQRGLHRGVTDCPPAKSSEPARISAALSSRTRKDRQREQALALLVDGGSGQQFQRTVLLDAKHRNLVRVLSNDHRVAGNSDVAHRSKVGGPGWRESWLRWNLPA